MKIVSKDVAQVALTRRLISVFIVCTWLKIPFHEFKTFYMGFVALSRLFHLCRAER